MSPLIVSGKSVTGLTIDYTYSGTQFREKALHFTAKNCVVYVLENYRVSNSEKAEKTWKRIVDSIQFTQ